MSLSVYISITITLVICGTILLIQYRHNRSLAGELTNEREAVDSLTIEGEASSSRDMSAEKALPPKSTIEGETTKPLDSSPQVTDAREIIKRMVADMESPSSSPIELFKMLPDILRVVQDLSVDQLLEVAEGLEGSESPNQQSGEASVRSILYLLVADQDPSLLLNDDELMKKPDMRMGALASLARQDPAAAKRWMESSDMSAPEKEHFQTMMLFQAMRNDTEKGVELLRELNEEKVSDFRMPMPLPLEKIDDLQKAMENPKNEDMRGTLMGMIVTSAMVHSGIAGARETVEGLEVSQEELSKVVSDVLNRTDSMRNEPKQTLAWLEEIQSPEEFRQSLPSAISRWAATDYNAAGEWLGNLEPSPSKDEAIQSFSSSIAGVDPEAAAIWSTQIQDEAQRQSAIQATVATWQQKDPEAANEWLRAEGLDPEDFAPSPPTSTNGE